MTGEHEGLRIEKLDRRHEVDTFDCGKEPLNRFLVRYALQNQKAGASQTYVALAEGLGATLVTADVRLARAVSRLVPVVTTA